MVKVNTVVVLATKIPATTRLRIANCKELKDETANQLRFLPNQGQAPKCNGDPWTIPGLEDQG